MSKMGVDERDIRVTSTGMSEAELSLFLIEAMDESDDDINRDDFLEATENLEESDLSTFKFISPFIRKKDMTTEDFAANGRNLQAYRNMLRENKKKQVLAIKRAHVSERRMPELYLPLVPEVIKAVITDLTAELRSIKVSYKERLTSSIERGLRAQMPAIIKTCFKRYPDCFIICPGFEYIASEHYGDFRLFIQPNIPDYFTDYMKIVNENLVGSRYVYDKYAEKYYEVSKQLIKQETKFAYKLAKFKNRLQLLEADVDLYLKYMEAYDEYKGN